MKEKYENLIGASDLKFVRLKQIFNSFALPKSRLMGGRLRWIEMEEVTTADTSFVATKLPEECKRKARGGVNGVKKFEPKKRVSGRRQIV